MKFRKFDFTACVMSIGILVLACLSGSSVTHAASVFPSNDSGVIFSRDSVAWSGELQNINLTRTVWADNQVWIAAVQVDSNSFFSALPVTVENTSTYKIALVGQLRLTDTTTGESVEWSATDAQTSSTMMVDAGSGSSPVLAKLISSSARGHTVTLTGQVRPVMFCTVTPCNPLGSEWGNFGITKKFRIPQVSIALRYENSWGDLRGAETVTILNSSNVDLISRCSVDIAPTNINFGLVRPRGKDQLLASARSNVLVSCNTRFFERFPVFKISIGLWPETPSADRTAALVSKSGLAVKYSWSNADPCRRPEYFGEVLEGSFYDSGYVPIYWGLCQTSSHVEPGDFTGRIIYQITPD